jgi:hypothetical protein
MNSRGPKRVITQLYPGNNIVNIVRVNIANYLAKILSLRHSLGTNSRSFHVQILS